MKCPQCWTEKAYHYPQQGWKARLLTCVGMVSMKCRHCFHKFHTPWLATIGQVMEPPSDNDDEADGPRIVPISQGKRRPDANKISPRRRAA